MSIEKLKEVEREMRDEPFSNGATPGRVANWADTIAAIIGQMEEQKPVAFIEHHKAGDNLNWERTDHSYAQDTPLYAMPSSPTCARLVEALDKIASCDSKFPGDVICIAREALAAYRSAK